jgi:hypothetical protein
VFALLGGAVALVVTWFGSVVTGLVAGVVTWVVCLIAAAWTARAAGPEDPSRRRFLVWTGLGGLVAVIGGTAIGRAASKAMRPDAVAVQEAAATDLGAEYMEVVARAYHPGRSGDLQLVLAPFNSANYPQESRSLVPQDPRTSHASVWMYLERIPLVVYGPGIVEPGDSEEPVTLADLAPTTAGLIGYGDWPDDREGRPLPGLVTTGEQPAVVVTLVIDGGGWNALQRWPGRWPNLEALMRDGANYRNATVGSFPAVTACAHATIGTGAFPRQHGITGHNIRDGSRVRKAYRAPGQADPTDIKIATLADLWHDATGAWVGEIGYQIWHLGMMGAGGSNNTPVGVYFDEDGDRGWLPHNPERYRMPVGAPGLERFAERLAAFENPGWDAEFAKWGNPYCCAPPIAAYQGDLLEATLLSEPVGGTAAGLLYTTFKSPDYTGHVYGMDSEWTGLMIEAVDTEIGRLRTLLDGAYRGRHVLIVTADHGQCPLPDAAGGVRLDPIQLESIIERRFGAGPAKAVQSVVPSEVYLDVEALRDAGADVGDVAAALHDVTYRETIGPYVPASAIEADRLDQSIFAAVFSTPYLGGLGDVTRFGETVYTGDDVDPGIPPAV